MDRSQRTVEERLAQLEREVEELRWVLARQWGASSGQSADVASGGPSHGSTAPAASPAESSSPVAGSSPADASQVGASSSPAASGRGGGARVRYPAGPRFDVSAVLGDPESWLAKGGVALVGLGVLLLFKYAVDQGWITPALRCVIGVAVGSALYLTAHRVRERHPVWSQIVVGGGLGVLYLSIWASSVLYGLVPVLLAFAGLALVSGEMVRQGAGVTNASLAVIGTIFGFAAPLLLSDVGQTAPLVVLGYAVILAGAALLVFMRRGWLLLVVATACGAFLLMAQLGEPPASQRVTVQVALAVLWLQVAIAPLIVDPPGGRVIGLGIPVDEGLRRFTRSSVLRLAVLGATVAALARTSTVWDIDDGTALGLLVAVPALLFGATAWLAHKRESDAYPAAVEASTLLSLIAAAIALRNGWLMAGEAAILTAAMWIATRTRAAGLTGIVHLGFVALGAGIGRVFQMDLTASRAIGALLAIASVVPTATLNPPPPARAYRVVGYGLLLFWLLWLLDPLPQGALVGSAVWGLIGTGLVVAGATRDRLSFERIGLATLGATAAKMLLYDLAGAETLWRIALFIGFGSVLLGVGYYLRERRTRDTAA